MPAASARMETSGERPSRVFIGGQNIRRMDIVIRIKQGPLARIVGLQALASLATAAGIVVSRNSELSRQMHTTRASAHSGNVSCRGLWPVQEEHVFRIRRRGVRNGTNKPEPTVWMRRSRSGLRRRIFVCPSHCPVELVGQRYGLAWPLPPRSLFGSILGKIPVFFTESPKNKGR